ncbi:UNVERIFIED_CONTAM: hypothetical protein Sangu_3129400 [Sesamum angustifolium]|uniref:Resistance protein n=1 Tax=Sesamum angustifolium TaxID=2727405 RepID=A0AAW2K0B3_9LAMI
MERWRNNPQKMCFMCSKSGSQLEVVERIPNLKKLKIKYYSIYNGNGKCSGFCLENLAYLHKLESLSLSSFTHWEKVPPYEQFGCGAGGQMYIAFPDSLKKLNLDGAGIPWENATTLIGSLPNLEVLKLLRHAFFGWSGIQKKGNFLD